MCTYIQARTKKHVHARKMVLEKSIQYFFKLSHGFVVEAFTHTQKRTQTHTNTNTIIALCKSKTRQFRYF